MQITALKTQMENDAKTIDRLNMEKSQIMGQIVELRGRITSLEGQVKLKNLRENFVTEFSNSLCKVCCLVENDDFWKDKLSKRQT